MDGPGCHLVGHWLKLRELSRLVNAEVKARRELVERVRE